MSLDASLHSDFRNIMTAMSKKVQEEFTENSFRLLFWEEQQGRKCEKQQTGAMASSHY